MQVLPGPVFVCATFLFDPALRTEHATVEQTLPAVVPRVELEHGLLRPLLVVETIYRAQLDRETALIFRERSSGIPFVFGQTRRRLLLCCRPPALILDLFRIINLLQMVVLIVLHAGLPVGKRRDLLLEAQGVDERLLLFFDRVLVSAVDCGLLERELVLLVLGLDGSLGLPLHHRRGHVPMEADSVGAVVAIGDSAVVTKARLCSPAFHLVLLAQATSMGRLVEKHLLIGGYVVERCIAIADGARREVLDLSAVLACAASHILHLAQLRLHVVNLSKDSRVGVRVT